MSENLATVFREFVEHRDQCQGLPVVNQEAHKESRGLLRAMEPLALMHCLNGEQRACAVFDWFYEAGILPDEFIPDRGRMVTELRFACRSRVDRAIFHDNGQLSIIEIKDDADRRSVVGGIGQALLYAALAEKEYRNTPVVPMLAVLGGYDADVARACSRGGVEYLPLGSTESLYLLSRVAAVACQR